MRKVQIFLRDFMWVPPNLEEDIIAAVSSAKDFVDWLPLITLYCVYLIVHWPYFEINLLHHPTIHSRLWRLKAAQSLISKKIQHFQPDTSRQHSTMKISGPNVSQGLDAFPQPIQANSYLIFVIFFTHTHILSHENFTLGKCVNLQQNCQKQYFSGSSGIFLHSAKIFTRTAFTAFMTNIRYDDIAGLPVWVLATLWERKVFFW